MAVQTKLCSFFTNLGNYRSILTSRIALHGTQPAAPISTATRNKLKELPEKPRKPATPFLKYSKDHRAEVAKRHPTAKVGEIAKALGEEWKTVDLALKQKYERQYKDEMIVYTTQNLQYLSNLTDEQKQVLSEAAKEKKHAKELRKVHQFNKESNKPKRVKPPYMYYIMEKTGGAKGGLKQALAEYKGAWAGLPEAEKIKYVQMSEDDKKRYELEMEVWEAKMIKEGHTDVVRKSTLDDHKPRRPAQRKASGE